MASRENAFVDITPDVLLKAYACGIFPMAESADDPALYWIEPEMRGILPLDGFQVASRLARTVRTTRFTVWVDRDFDAVIEGCAEPKPDRGKTWINAASAASTARCSTPAIATPSRSMTAILWLVVSMACRSVALSSARACFTTRATRPRSHWCIWSRA